MTALRLGLGTDGWRASKEGRSEQGDVVWKGQDGTALDGEERCDAILSISDISAARPEAGLVAINAAGGGSRRRLSEKVPSALARDPTGAATLWTAPGDRVCGKGRTANLSHPPSQHGSPPARKGDEKKGKRTDEHGRADESSRGLGRQESRFAST
ncbi:hypothetical protein BP6252_02295 [Coleophoma cylindrospora]|uniref:Uncharacterized protein n=1 Tax=Coleophoma cylindrospora TaxID=1849047 RepID=A0A3D8SEE8_9HELO|nr:hypothetical protein BP6252_02295 [Coleophoma cylindrospora]